MKTHDMQKRETMAETTIAVFQIRHFSFRNQITSIQLQSLGDQKNGYGSRSRSKEGRRDLSPPKGSTLYLSNLPRRFEDADLQDLLSKFGTVTKLEVIKEPMTK